MTPPPPSGPSFGPPSELVTLFGRANGYLLTELTAYDAVDGLAEIARDIIGAAQGAGVSLMDRDGKCLSVGATDTHVRQADDLQYALSEGPCIAAWSSGLPVLLTDTRTDNRWQRWIAAATSAGIRSCLSVPLLHKQTGLGAMKVYSDQAGAFTKADQKLLMNLARSAAALLGHIQASDTPQRISNDIKASLADRDTVGIARGILMERLNIDKQAAMNHLIDTATDTNATITSVAARINERQDGPDHTHSA